MCAIADGVSREWCWRLARFMFGAGIFAAFAVDVARKRSLLLWATCPHFGSRCSSLCDRAPSGLLRPPKPHRAELRLLSRCERMVHSCVLAACTTAPHAFPPASLPPVTVRHQGFYCHPRLIALYISLVASAVGLIAGLALHPRTRGEDWAGVRNTLYGATVRGLCCQCFFSSCGGLIP